MTTVKDVIVALEKLPETTQLVIGKQGDSIGHFSEYDFLIERRNYGFDMSNNGYYALCPCHVLSKGAIKR